MQCKCSGSKKHFMLPGLKLCFINKCKGKVPSSDIVIRACCLTSENTLVVCCDCLLRLYLSKTHLLAKEQTQIGGLNINARSWSSLMAIKGT